MSNETLRRKLHSVGMRVTKLTRDGKLKPLTRRELQTSARIFRDLQIDAKKMNIRITYLSKDGSRKYKTYKRLLSDMAKGIRSSFGGWQSSKKPSNNFGGWRSNNDDELVMKMKNSSFGSWSAKKIK